MGIIQRQGIYNTLITYIGIIIGFVSLLIIQPRFLSIEEIGLTRVLFSFSVLISTFMPFGMNSITLRFFPAFRNREKGHYGFFGLMLLMPIIGFILISIILYIFKDLIISQYIQNSKLFTDYFYYVFPMTFFLCFIMVLNAYSFSLFKTIFPSLLNDILVRILSIIIFTLYFIKIIDRDQMVFLFVSIYGVQFLALVIYIFRIDKPRLRFDREFLKTQNPTAMLKYGLLLSFVSLSSLGLKYLDTVMLGKFVPLGLVGIYSIVAFIPTVIEAPLTALEKIGISSIANAWSKNNMQEIREIYFKSSRYLFLAGGLLFLEINLNIESLLRLMPHKEYMLGLNVVFIISLGNLINMATGINDSIIYTSEKYVYGSYMLIILLFLAIVNNLIFIPLYGIEGAAFATALSAFIFNMMKYLFIWKTFKLQPLDKKTIWIALLIGSLWVMCHFLPHISGEIFDIAFRSVFILILFVGGVYLLKIVPELHKFLPFRLKNR